MPVLALPRVDFEAGARLASAGLVAAVAIAAVGLSVALGRAAAPPAHLPLMRAVALPGVASSPPPTPESPAAPVPSRRRVGPSGAAPLVPVEPTAPAVAAAAATAVAPFPPPPPSGKGMWIWQPERTEGGDPAAIVARARAVGLTHLFVRTGSTWDGLQNGPFLDALLPLAHAAGLRVFGWDFPKLAAPPDDVARAVAALGRRAPGGHYLDGFAADIETAQEGTQLTIPGVLAYGAALRQAVGPTQFLIAAVPNPTPQMLERYPFPEVVGPFDAIAPMVYWLNRQPDTDVTGALRDLAPYGKPVFPVGQAYDGKSEGGRPGVPTPDELLRFMRAGLAGGAQGVSFWSWQDTTPEEWDAIRGAPQFSLPTAPAAMTPGQIRTWQVLLNSLGFPAPPTGVWDQASVTAV